MTLKETQKAIKLIKVFFEHELSERLLLTRVSAPLFVERGTGINDDLNGIERPVSFDILDSGKEVEIVQSLAKWKRKALKDYEFTLGEGLYTKDQRAVVVHSLAKWKRIRLKELELEPEEGILTDMRALRPDEDYSPIHSIYVDQWDWEKIIGEGDRNLETLKDTVRIIYSIFKDAEILLREQYPFLTPELPETITFITTEELYAKYPDKTPKERERAFAKETGAYFLIGIGDLLPDGEKHGGRAHDYVAWQLNGDPLFYYGVHDDVLELSSMGIRVDKKALLSQLGKSGKEDRMSLPFHRQLLEGELPQTMGGGIGQSRICQFLLKKYHIGEVQSSIWPEKIREEMAKINVSLL